MPCAHRRRSGCINGGKCLEELPPPFSFERPHKRNYVHGWIHCDPYHHSHPHSDLGLAPLRPATFPRFAAHTRQHHPPLADADAADHRDPSCNIEHHPRRAERCARGATRLGHGQSCRVAPRAKRLHPSPARRPRLAARRVVVIRPVVLVLVFRYATSVAAAFHPQLYANLAWQLGTAFVSTALSALFLGRTMARLRVYFEATRAIS